MCANSYYFSPYSPRGDDPVSRRGLIKYISFYWFRPRRMLTQGLKVYIIYPGRRPQSTWTARVYIILWDGRVAVPPRGGYLGGTRLPDRKLPLV